MDFTWDLISAEPKTKRPTVSKTSFLRKILKTLTALEAQGGCGRKKGFECLIQTHVTLRVLLSQTAISTEKYVSDIDRIF